MRLDNIGKLKNQLQAFLHNNTPLQLEAKRILQGTQESPKTIALKKKNA